MAKLVCHAEKYKKGSVSSIERHNERKNMNYSNEEIDSSRTHLNYSLIQRDDESYYRSVMKLVNARDNPSGRTLRKDAVVLCEFIISSSNEFFDTKAKIKSIEQIPTGKTIFGGKITVDEDAYKKVTSLAKKQLASESKEKKLSKELSSLQKENNTLKIENEGMKIQLNKRQSISKRLSTATMESELHELRMFKKLAEKFLSEHGLLDYFRKAFIHSNNRDL